MKKYLFLALIFSALSCGRGGEVMEVEATVPATDTVYEYGIPVSNFEMTEGEIKKSEFFTNLMTNLGASLDEANMLVKESEGIFDLKKIKVGNRYKAYYTTGEDPELAYLIYFSDRKTYVTFNLYDTINVSVTQLETTLKRRVSETTISSSLWDDIKRSGASPLLALRLSDIYAWSIDFFALRKGDRFRVLYDEIYVDGQFYDIGEVYAADFTHMGKSYKAYHYTLDTASGYWSEIGENLKKAFLKAPLSFIRISSRFTYARRHPVLRIVRPHTGVDYAAPKGTPVMSIGDGVVIQKGYAGGGGNTVKIKHNTMYTSAYLHLSGYGPGVSKGARVRQGQIIGYVGSTGISTGPHLDFRVWKNGSPVDPLKMDSPPAKKIGSKEMPAFTQYMQKVHIEADSLMASYAVDSLIGKLIKR